jgi:hypothetical protein
MGIDGRLIGLVLNVGRAEHLGPNWYTSIMGVWVPAST